MEKQEVSNKEKDFLEKKKKLAMFLAGIITFFIFCVWIFFFLQDLGSFTKDSKGGFGSFIGDIKKNTKQSFSEIQNVTGELNKKIRLIGDYYLNKETVSNFATTTEIEKSDK